MDKPSIKKQLETRQKIRNRVRQMRNKQSDSNTNKDMNDPTVEVDSPSRDKTRQQIRDLFNSMKSK